MKNIKFLIVCILTFLVFNILSCKYSYIGDITIKNNSGQEITDLIIFVPYHYTEYGNFTRIGGLSVNETIKVKYDFLEESFNVSARTVTNDVGIEYFINGIKFGMDDEYDYIIIGSFFDTFITINEDGWIAQTN